LDFWDEATIAAISTPLGEGGIGIIRISGSNAIAVADKMVILARGGKVADLPSRRIANGFVVDDDGRKVDEVLVVVMRAPKSYTGEDVVEIHCHGGIVAMRKTLRLALKNGARAAAPGEFTKRAFVNGRLDLAQAEAVAGIIGAKTEAALRAAAGQLEGRLSKLIREERDRLLKIIAAVEAAIDFPEEGLEEITAPEIASELKSISDNLSQMLNWASRGKILREGLATAIVGRPNVGKSSLLNWPAGAEKAIVTEEPGTTRDVVEEWVNVEGIPLKIMDTAGIRDARDKAEKIGVERAKAVMGSADLVLLVIDGSEKLQEEDKGLIRDALRRTSLIAVNKKDLGIKVTLDDAAAAVAQEELAAADLSKIKAELEEKMIFLSAATGEGVNELERRIAALALAGTIVPGESAIMVSSRQEALALKAKDCVEQACRGFGQGVSLDCLAVDLREAWEALGHIVGESVSDEIVDEIFSRFCIGK